MTPDEARAYLTEWRPATDLLVAHLADTVKEHREHQHPARGEDFFCLNLTSFMGERMGPVLRRLLDAEAEIEQWKAKHTALAEEAAGYLNQLAELGVEVNEA